MTYECSSCYTTKTENKSQLYGSVCDDIFDETIALVDGVSQQSTPYYDIY